MFVTITDVVKRNLRVHAPWGCVRDGCGLLILAAVLMLSAPPEPLLSGEPGVTTNE